MSTAQMFTREHIIPQLVSWFNALPDDQRMVRPTDVPFFNVKVIQDPAEPTLSRIVVGDQSLAVDPVLVLGEATFTWVGRRHLNLPRTATQADFFEVAKNVAMLDLKEPAGASLVGTSGGQTVQAALDEHTTTLDEHAITLDEHTAAIAAIGTGGGGGGGGGMANPMTTAGDIIYGGAAGTATRLPKGSNGQALVITAGNPAWNSLAPVATSGSYADLTSKPTIPATPGDIGAATTAQGAKADTALQPAAVGVSVAGLTAGKVPSGQLPSTDGVTEGSTNLYFAGSRVLSTVLAGFSTATSTVASAADSVLAALGKLQAQVSLRLAILAAFSNTTTSGTNASSTIDLSVAPSGNSTQVAIGKRVSISYNSSSNMTTGGYLMPGQDVLNTAGTGTHDKLVGRNSQMNLTGGNVASAIGFEASVSTVGATTLIGGYAGYYFPNLAGVANIANITTLAAFSNDETRAIVRSAGPFVNADLREIAPSAHAGLATGRYYSAPAKSMTQNIVAVNTIYVTYVHVPRRCTIAVLGFNVTTGATGSGIVGMYKVKDTMLTTLVAQTGALSTATTGAREGAVSVQIDSGLYAIVAVFNATPTIGWHEINSHHIIGASSITGFSEQAYISSSFGTLPTTANIAPTFAANTIEPHLWFRITS